MQPSLSSQQSSSEHKTSMVLSSFSSCYSDKDDLSNDSWADSFRDKTYSS